MKASTEFVISVHGTFAAKSEDEGHEWWQHRSNFWQNLTQCLPGHIQQIPQEQTFHWSGKNSATERRAAARRLLKLMQKLDKARQPYHLIGHSHGGSVIWDALLLAASSRRSGNKKKGSPDGPLALPGLLSWTSVGTPFIRSRASLSRIVLAFFSGTIMLSSLFALLVFTFNFSDAVSEPGPGFATTSLMIVMSLAIFYASLGSTIAGLESQRADTENQIAAKILKASGAQWLGLWHSADEAINGLRVSLALSGDIIPRRYKFYHAFAYPKLSMLFVPLALIVNPVFNLILAPTGDRFVWKRIKNSATGNDRPGTFAREVERAPLLYSDALPNLPERVENALTKTADRATQAAAPKLRQLLARLSNGLGKGLAVEMQQSGLSGRELIHTSYFDDPDVTLLIAEHLSQNSDTPVKLDVPEDLRNWSDEFQSAVSDLVASQPRSFAAIFKALLVLLTLITAAYLMFLGYNIFYKG